MGTAVFGTWMANFVVTLVFPPLIDAIGGATFLIFTAINAATIAYSRDPGPLDGNRRGPLPPAVRHLTTPSL